MWSNVTGSESGNIIIFQFSEVLNSLYLSGLLESAKIERVQKTLGRILISDDN